MSYIKLGQIIDQSSKGMVYVEDQEQTVHVNVSPSFPLIVLAEVNTWESQAEQEKSGIRTSLVSETITVPDQSVSIRQSVLNQLIGKYPSLVM